MTGVRRYGLHGSWSKDQDNSRPGEPRFLRSENRGDNQVRESYGSPRRSKLYGLSEVDSAATQDFSAPIAGPDFGRVQKWSFLCGAHDIEALPSMET
jgi:hypothetical protein